MKILVTGSAGFIGYHLCVRLLREGHSVVGIDNLNDYYDVNLKFSRLAGLGVSRDMISYSGMIKSKGNDNFSFCRLDLSDAGNLERLFGAEGFDVICNLAAQAGVRYSMENPAAYIDSNVTGFLNILEAARRHPVKHIVFASSSSVYGQNSKTPFSESDSVDHPISLYAASKKTNELMAHTYSHLFGIPMTGLRFFTVYGPWGRPDMAPFLFANAIKNGKPLQVFNNGNMKRDFTFIDDIIESTYRIMLMPPQPGNLGDTPATSWAPYNIYNIGRGEPVDLLEFIHCIEEAFSKKAILEMQPMQAGDVPITWADVTRLASITGYKPKVSIQHGVDLFVDWYKSYFRQ